MTLGTLRECTIGKLRLKTQADGDAKVRPEGILPTMIITGNGRQVTRGEVQGGKIVIPCILTLDDLVNLQNIINNSPDGGYPCTFTLINYKVWGFSGTIVSDLETSLKEGKIDLEFSVTGLRGLT